MKRPLGTGDLVKKLDVKDDETILLNCRKLIAKGLIYDKETKKKGKYTFVKNSKIPAFLMYRARNRSLKFKILHDIFPSTNKNESIKSLDDFSKNIGIYISYVLLEAIKPGGPWTSKGFETNDPRMNNIDLLRETWLEDTIDQESFFKQFLLLGKYNDDNNYQELVKKFESIFPKIYRKIVFHEQADKMRKLRKNKKNNKKQIERSDEEIYGEIDAGYYDHLDRKEKHGIKMN